MNIQRKNSAHHFRMQSEREQTCSDRFSTLRENPHEEVDENDNYYYYE